MALIIHEKVVPTSGKFIIKGNKCNVVYMLDKEVWRREEWETLFSGSQTFGATGSMEIPGLKPGDTVTISATAKFVEFIENSENAYDDSVIQTALPTSLSYQTHASIDLTVGANKIDFKFSESTQSLKGLVVRYMPVNLTITEIRRKT